MNLVKKDKSLVFIDSLKGGQGDSDPTPQQILHDHFSILPKQLAHTFLSIFWTSRGLIHQTQWGAINRAPTQSEGRMSTQ